MIRSAQDNASLWLFARPVRGSPRAPPSRFGGQRAALETRREPLIVWPRRESLRSRRVRRLFSEPAPSWARFRARGTSAPPAHCQRAGIRPHFSCLNPRVQPLQRPRRRVPHRLPHLCHLRRALPRRTCPAPNRPPESRDHGGGNDRAAQSSSQLAASRNPIE